MNHNLPGRNSGKGGMKGQTKGMLLIISLVLIAGIVVYALNASKRPKGYSGSVPYSYSNLP